MTDEEFFDFAVVICGMFLFTIVVDLITGGKK